jgi:hydrogenase maturation factor/phosphoglycolate phosphatase-like HAD superfamily hydrolase
MQTETMHIQAVLFQLEGTLIQPGSQDPDATKASIGCPAESSTTEFIRNLPDAENKKRALSTLERLELKAADDTKPSSGADALMRYLKMKDLRLAIVSHGCEASVHKVLNMLSFMSRSDLDAIISREESLPQNSSIDPIQLAVEKMNLPPDQVLVVAGDPAIIRDAQKIGAVTVFFEPSVSADETRADRPFQISHLEELIPIVRMGIPLPAGKLPNDLLREFLNQFVFDDSSILITPSVGEDIAAVNVEPEEVLVLKSDPITFATDSIGQYAVLINANDIATSGAKPRWLLTTLLFPCGVTPSEIRKVINELKVFCRQWDITLCGGHTEITDAVNRPVVTGMMAGTVARRDLIDKRNMASGDRVLLTKAVAVEGTAIIAREFGDRLKDLGMADSDVDSCRRFLTNISIITEAQIAAESKATSAMHDVTEGGLATAVEELSIAGGHKLKIEMETIPVFAQTRKICRLLGINPLGLIGSGSLLICCREAGCENLMKAIRKGGIDVTCIGEVLEKGQGITSAQGPQAAAWPKFEADEITRLF